MNKLLQRQLKKVYGRNTNIPSEIAPLLQIITDTYDGFDQDRELTIRSLELSSQELLDANRKLGEETQRQKAILEALRAATSVLKPSSAEKKEWLTSADEVIYLAESLTQLIEEQKQHELELIHSKVQTEQEKAKAEAILLSIGDGVFAVDLDLRIMLMNPIAEQLSGYSFAEAEGRPYNQIFSFKTEHDPDAPYPNFVQDVMSSGKIRALTNHTLLVRKDKTELSVSDSAAPIVSENGKIIGCIVVVRDASRERELERAKDDFISITAHQLRTPLGIVRWHAEMLLRNTLLDAATRSKLKHVHASNLRLIALVNDLLNVSRIDQGRVQDNPHSTHVCEVIRDAYSELEPLAQQLNVTVNLLLKDGCDKEIFIDSKRLEEVILNLLSNAIKYNVPGGKVDVTTMMQDEFIAISFSDTGIGIPLEDQKRMFDKFHRAKNATRNDTTGTGLGMYIVKSYVDAWSGKIAFQSTEGKGSTFVISIPLSSTQSTTQLVE
ncbi:MAG: ATP-binding protein [Patescibacteria group bacterium]